MDLTTYEKIIKTENSARKYLLEFCWNNHQRYCPRCRTRKLYRLADKKNKEKKRRCSRCGYTFHDFSQRFVNLGNLSCQQWLRLFKLFELDIATSRMPVQLGLSANTVYKAVNTLRMAILAHSLDAPILLSNHAHELGFLQGSSVAAGLSADFLPVFGVIEKYGQVFIDFLPYITVSQVLHFKQNFHLKTAKLGNIVYSDRYKQYETLIYYEGGNSFLYDIRHEDKGLVVDVNRGFWLEARKKMRRFKGILPHKFPLYLKELEFRYNNKDQDIFGLLAKYLCAFVPKLE